MRLSALPLAFCLLASCVIASCLPAPAISAQEPVKEIARQATMIRTPSGEAVLPLEISADWTKPQPEVTRAVLYVHGKGRDVEGYYHGLQRSAMAAGAAARGTLLLAPQFLNQTDVEAHGLPGNVVRWRTGSFEAGVPAVGPVPVSAYEVLDALLLHLADRTLFPALTEVVLAGHSGGGQAVQRYAVVGRAPAQLTAAGVHVRFVIANPSSYLYFSDDRPVPPQAGCRNWDRWKYGERDAPPYVKAVKESWQEMETRYAAADVIYLMGADDTDPEQKDLDTTCGGEAQGPTRLLRGENYFRYLHQRHPGSGQWTQRLWLVPGVGHSGPRMVEAPCGVRALFPAAGTCPDWQP